MAKILILSTWDDQGSGSVLYRISKFLLEAGHEVVLMVRDKSRFDSFIIQVPIQRSISQRILNRLFLKFYSNLKTDPAYDFLNIDENAKLVEGDYILSVLPFKPDLIITGLVSGFVNTTTLAELKAATKARIYMLTVDMSPFTGGCHYAWNCTGYKRDCSNCPAILDENRKDKAQRNLMIKLENVKKANIKILAGSGWTFNQARLSTLFKDQDNIYNVNSCIDTNLFNCNHRDYAKKIFDLPENSKIIFTGSSFTHGKRKGLIYFIEALEHLWNLLDEKSKDNIFVLIAGNHSSKNDLTEQIPFKKKLIDFIKDDRLLSLAYQASNVFVCSSIEDSGPLMVSEALACGTPVVGFEMGVTSNMVVNGYNGYKAELRNSKDLANGMFKILSLSKEEHQTFSRNAVSQVEKYSSAETFIEVINKILSE